MWLGLSEHVEWRGKIKIETERHGARIDGTQAACGSNAALPHCPSQYRAGAGSARRDPGEQRGVLPGLRLPRAAALLRADPSKDLRGLRAAGACRQDRNAD